MTVERILRGCDAGGREKKNCPSQCFPLNIFLLGGLQTVLRLIRRQMIHFYLNLSPQKTPVFCAKYWNKIGSDAVENSHMESLIFFRDFNTAIICIKTQET